MRVLLVVHGFPPQAQGGSEIYADAHARALHSRFGDDVVVLTRENDRSRPEYSRRDTNYHGVHVVWVNNTFRQVRSFEESYANGAVADIASALIAEVRPDVAHVHHLTCLSSFIPERLAAAGVPAFMTLHDYWLLCHRGQLLDRDCQVCHAAVNGCGRCVDDGATGPPAIGAAAALVRRFEPAFPRAARQLVRATGTRLSGLLADPGASAAAAASRSIHMRNAVANITRFFAPSAHLRDRFVAAGYGSERIELSRYGFVTDGWQRTRAHRSGPLRLGFVGSLMVSKAPHLLLEAAARLPAGRVTVDLFGAPVPYHGDDSYCVRLERWLSSPGVHVHGNVPHELMGRIFESFDVLVVPSIWPENSPLVIQEAFLAGVPVVASRTGGIPELVRHEENGLLVEPGDVEGLRRALLRLLDEPGLLERLRDHGGEVRSIEDDTRCLRDWYVGTMRRARPIPVPVPGVISIATPSSTQALPAPASLSACAPATGSVHAVVLNYHTPDATLLAVRSLMASRHPLASILVVDNSDDVACGRMLGDVAAHVDYVSTVTNLGYSGGMNVGVRRAIAAGATHVLLVNSDMTVPPDCLGRLLEELSAHPTAGLVGPTVLARSAPDRIASLGLFYDGTTGRMKHRRFDEPLADANGDVGAVTAVSGCLMLIARAVFERVGFFDEAYFFGFEDLDLCLRAARLGFSSRVSAAVAYHEGGQSLPASSADRVYYATRNHLRLAARTSNPDSRRGSLLRSVSILGLNAAYALKAPPSRISARLRAVSRGAIDHWRDRYGPLR
ncbi:MAG TPA: glycosyltransferase [Vicinamibacterales bacterium]|nr:glycosyltransferase [Vicinamibacterales bacterium]